MQRNKIGRCWAWVRKRVLWMVPLYWLAMVLGTHWPSSPHPTHGHIDKLMHFSAYAGLAFLIAAFLSNRGKLSLGYAVMVLALLAIVGACDEISQPWVGRDCDILDWYADMTGVLFGLGLAFAMDRLSVERPPSVSPPSGESA